MTDNEVSELRQQVIRLEGQLAFARNELERWRRMASAITPMLRAMVGEDKYAEIMGINAPAHDLS